MCVFGARVWCCVRYSSTDHTFYVQSLTKHTTDHTTDHTLFGGLFHRIL